jgi:SsrA-binding protein
MSISCPLDINKMKLLHKNKKAYFDYEILDEFTAGIVLTGAEIKSVRDDHVDMKSSFVSILGGEAFIKNLNISRYKYDQNKDYDPFRDRKLLLKKNEIEKIAAKLNTQGVTVIPLAVVLENGFAKILIGIARGKKQYDKRETLKKKDQKRTIDKLIKSYR